MPSIIEQIKQKASIVDVVSGYLDLTKKGRNYWALCPFHEDSNPSMSVSDQKQLFKCFVCGKGGNVINFVAEFEKIPFAKALEKLAKKYNISYHHHQGIEPKYNQEQLKLIEALNEAANFFQYQLNNYQNNQEISEYLKQRKIKQKIIEKFAIGFAPAGEELANFLISKGHDEATLINGSLINNRRQSFFKNRLIFPIKNRFNDVVAFSGRVLDDQEPKYLNSRESQIFSKSKLLYNTNHVQNNIENERSIIICEGFMDVIALHKANYDNALALMGTTLTNHHLGLIKDKEIILMLDGDQAGIKATLKSLKLLLTQKINVYVAILQPGSDPDQIFNEQGQDGIDQILSNKQEGIEFVYQFFQGNIKNESPQKIKELVLDFSDYLKHSGNLEIDFYIHKIAERFKLSIDTIKDILPFKVKQNSHSLVKNTSPEPQVEKTVKNNYSPPQKETIKPINYPYILIRSMLKKPFLIDLLQEHPVHFTDSILLGLAKCLVTIRTKGKIEVPLKYKEVFSDIKKESKTIVNTQEEFLELIELINKQSRQTWIDIINVKLNKATSEEEVLEYLNILKKLKKGKQK